ncbi:MAG: thioredoxin domain-containing protein [Pirellulales bacterium]
MPNRLANESSPYLLQHKDNPVDWYPWGSEALERAKQEEKPIFLSIGYSACHWCHVMEHESFEDEAISRQLNDDFVCVKVDREERPDLDQIYMNAVQMITGRGGWPMSVFLTPDLKPFYGGTYWPPRSRMGMPGFDDVLRAVHDAWHNRRDQATTGAEQLTEQLQRLGQVSGGSGELSPDLLRHAEAALGREFDSRHGGIGQAPKFPRPMDVSLLLRIWSRHRRDDVLHMVCLTLDKMAAGGIYDHLGGGFARYSVDDRWLVPHFEKMLYDNALLTAAYVEAYQATHNEYYARVVRETIGYVLRDMIDPAGGFYSTEDADSEGEEGKFYTWTRQEILDVLAEEDAEVFARVYDVSEEGNFEGKNILNLPKSVPQYAKILNRDATELAQQLARCRKKLFDVREQRIRPARDDKVIVSWNGLMIDALARASTVLGDAAYLQAATRAADFLLANLRRDDGRLLHTWRGGVAKLDAYLDDYACLINGLVSVYESGFQRQYIAAAVELAEQMLAQFHDPDVGGFYYTARDHEPLIARSKDFTDSSVPGGNSMAATALLRLGKLTGTTKYIDAAVDTLQAGTGVMERAPTAAGQLLVALDMHLGPMYQFVVVGQADDAETVGALAHLRGAFLPRKVVAFRQVDEPADSAGPLAELFAGKEASESPTVYICEDFACQAPVTGRKAIAAEIDHLANRTP